MNAGRIPRSVGSFPVVFEAAPDAPRRDYAFASARRRRSAAHRKLMIPPPLISTIRALSFSLVRPIAAAVIGKLRSNWNGRAARPLVKTGGSPLRCRPRAAGNPGRSPCVSSGILPASAALSPSISLETRPRRTTTQRLSRRLARRLAVCVLAEADAPMGRCSASVLTPLKIAEPAWHSLDLAAAESSKPWPCWRRSASPAREGNESRTLGPARRLLPGTFHRRPDRTHAPQIADARPENTAFLHRHVPENSAMVVHHTAMGARSHRSTRQGTAKPASAAKPSRRHRALSASNNSASANREPCQFGITANRKVAKDRSGAAD
jgi:hypothetical protein